MKAENKAKIIKNIGIIFAATSLLGLIGWLGSSEPDCYYTTEIFAQYRYCEEKWSGNEKSINYVVFIICISSFTLGMLLIRRGRNLQKKIIRHNSNR